MEVLREIATYIVYGLTGLLSWLILQHFSLRERVSRLEDRVSENFKQDEGRAKREDKLWDAIEGIKNDIHDLKTSIELIKNSLTKP